MTNVNQVGNNLTGQEGTGAFVGDNSPNLTTPDIGVATGTSLNLGSSTTMTGMIDDDTFGTASASTAASSESILALVNNTNKVVQMVYATYATEETTSSTSFQPSSLSASITPTSTSNQIVIWVTCRFALNNPGANITNHYGKIQVYNTTDTNTVGGEYKMGETFSANNSTNHRQWFEGTIVVRETAQSTSSTTYELQFNSGSSSATAAVFSDNQIGTMLIMEVAP